MNTLSAWPSYSREEREAVDRVLASGRVNYWTGEEGRSFEKEFSEFCGVRYSIALANGTVALELALRALGIGPGDEVIVTPRTFIASASAVVMLGAMPVFAEVDNESQNITADTVRAVLTPRTRAVIAVHLAGWPCDMYGLRNLVREHGLYLIEDCAQAHGAVYKAHPVGGLGDVAAWSFCQDKIMNTGGEGGMLTTNDGMIWEKAWSFKDHGKSWDAVYNRAHPTGFRWLHESFGSNLRMTELQAVIGRVQLKKMPKWHAARKRNAEAILDTCEGFPSLLRVARPVAGIEHAWYKCYVFVRTAGLALGWTRDRIMEEITAAGVPCFSGSCPEVYLEKAFVGAGKNPPERFPVARMLGETSLVFLVHPTLSKGDLEKMCSVIERVATLAGGESKNN